MVAATGDSGEAQRLPEMCLDRMDINQYIRREHYHIPHKSEILSEMANARYFTKMDASQGFYQIQLDEKSTQLCTVATPFGRYPFKRLLYALNCAPEIFHAKIQQLFECQTRHSSQRLHSGLWTNKSRTRRSTEEGVGHRQTLWIQTEREKCVFGVTELTFL